MGSHEILELALHGKVIIRGWGGAEVLRHIPHVIRVRIRAPMEKRVDEMFRRLNEAAWEASKPIEHAPSFVRDGRGSPGARQGAKSSATIGRTRG